MKLSFLSNISFLATGRLTFVSFTAVSSVYFFLLIIAISAKNLRTIFGDNSTSPEATVFMTDGASEAMIHEFRQSLTRWNFIESVEFVSKEAALKEFKDSISNWISDSELWESGNPLPATFQLRLIPKLLNSVQQTQWLAELRSLPGVSDVALAGQFFDQYRALFNVFNTVGITFAVIMMLGTLLILSGVIYARINACRQEIELLELVGASPNQIRRPFLLMSVRFSVGCYLLATIMAVLLGWLLRQLLTTFPEFTSLAARLQYLSIPESLFGLLLAVGFSYLSADFTIRAISNGWSALRRSYI